MDDRKCKGAVINGHLKYIKKKWGQQAVDEALKFAGFSRLPRDGEWVPVDKNHQIHRWLIKNKGRKAPYDAARYAAKDLGIFSFIFSFIGLEKLIEKARLNYRTLFNYGDIVIEKLEEKKIKVIMKDVGTEPFICDVWEGTITGLLDATKSGGTIMRTNSERPADCVYIIRWN